MVRFIEVEKDYQDYDTDAIGIAKDSYVNLQFPTLNYGVTTYFDLIDVASVAESITVLEIKMPGKDDILGADEIFKVELGLYVQFMTILGTQPISIYDLNALDSNWEEGTQNGVAGECNFQKRDVVPDWSNFAATGTLYSGTENSLQSLNVTGIGWYWLDITSSLKFGDRKSFFLRNHSGDAVALLRLSSRETATPAQAPILRITYLSYPPEGFEGDDGLTISPNPDDPEQPLLKWGAVKSDDFSQYKLYQSVLDISTVDDYKSAITAVSIANDTFTVAGDVTDAFPVDSTFKVSGRVAENGRYTVVSAVYGAATVIEVAEDLTVATVDGFIHHGIYTTTNPADVQLIDDSSLSDGSPYNYKIISEDQDNHEDDALLSAPVMFWKPDVTTGTMTRTDLAAWTGSVDVGTSVTMTVVSPQNIKRVYVDWKDGVTSWYDFETVALSQAITHIYVQDSGGAVTPDVRVQDDLGFWSSLTAATNTVDVNDTTPVAKLIVSAKEAIVGDDITLNATYSQPAGSNVTITKYEFKRDAADSYQDNGTNPIYTFDSGTYPNSVGTKTATVRITTSTALTDTDTATYDLVTGTPTEITPGYTDPAGVLPDGLSNSTSIHDLQHIYAQNKMVGVPIGAAGTAKEFRISTPPQKFTMQASTDWPLMGDDLDIIRSAWQNNTYLRLVQTTENEDKDIQYDFMLEGDVSIGHQFQNKLNWSFPVRVINRTEVAKLPLIQAITAYSNPGGGKVQATSNAHGLLDGQTVLIRGSLNYNGTYVVSVVTTNTFRFVATWVADDAMGTWAKVGAT